MKKIISALLILVMCFGLCACGNVGGSEDDREESGNNSSKKNEIVGQWICFDYGFSLTFRKNGTGTDGDGGTFTWKYDEDLKYYTIAAQREDGVFTDNIMIQRTKNPAITYIIVQGEKIYRMGSSASKGNVPVIVLSDAMAPVMYGGDVILCQPVKDPAKLQIGDIISFWTVIDGQRVCNTSRIKGIYDGGGFLLFETKGDACEDADPLVVHESEIVGTFSEVIVDTNNPLSQ